MQRKHNRRAASHRPQGPAHRERARNITNGRANQDDWSPLGFLCSLERWDPRRIGELGLSGVHGASVRRKIRVGAMAANKFRSESDLGRRLWRSGGWGWRSIEVRGCKILWEGTWGPESSSSISVDLPNCTMRVGGRGGVNIRDGWGPS